MSRDRIHSFAEEVATYVLIKSDATELPVDLNRVASYLRVQDIEYRPLSAEGYVEALGMDGYKIVLRLGRSPQRTRFSLAHELGHVLIHKLCGTPGSSLSRRYRSFSSVSDSVDEEAVADALAGAILIPPSVVARVLPPKFSMRGVAQLAEMTDSSVPTALLRAMWYATQPCFAFHFRWFIGRPESLKCMWVHSSRSFPSLSRERASELVGQLALDAARQPGASRFVRFDPKDGAIFHVDICRTRFFERESLYGIAFVRPGWETSLFSLDGSDLPEQREVPTF